MSHFVSSALIALAALAPASCAMGAMEMPTDAERAVFDQGSAATLSLQSLGVLADNLFDFGFAIDPRATDSGNANNIALAVNNRVQGCGTATASGATVSVDFTTGGCAVRNGSRISGTAMLTVMRVGPDTVVATSIPSVTVDGYAIAGTVSFATASGSHFGATGTLTGGGVTLTLGDRSITYDGTGNSFSIDGGVSINNGSATSSATITGASYTLGDCFVHAGSMTITTASATDSLTFDAQTATAGTTTFVHSDRSFTLALLPHGNCPAH